MLCHCVLDICDLQETPSNPLKHLITACEIFVKIYSFEVCSVANKTEQSSQLHVLSGLL